MAETVEEFQDFTVATHWERSVVLPVQACAWLQASHTGFERLHSAGLWHH